MDGKKFLLVWFSLLAITLGEHKAVAASLELTGQIAYGRAQFGDGYKSTQRRYTGSMDFKFTSVSAFQVEYSDSRTNVSYPTNVGTLLPYYTQESTTYRDKVYSFNWVQNLVPSTWILQPYFLVGGGKMRRVLTKEYPELGLKETEVQSVTTGTGGVGVRLFLTRSIALKGEVKTYVPKFQFSKWKENELYSTGLSFLF